MRKAQQYLDFTSTLHDLLLIIEKCNPTLNAFRRMMKTKEGADYWIRVLHDMGCVRSVHIPFAERGVARLSLTEKGYAYRGITEDHWDVWSTMSHFIADRLPARNAIGPIIPSLLSSSGRKFEQIREALNAVEKDEVRCCIQGQHKA